MLILNTRCDLAVLPQQSLFTESQRTVTLEQTVADLRRQLAERAGQIVGW
jgi:hypothetical protein